jgi:hypothetical protein
MALATGPVLQVRGNGDRPVSAIVRPAPAARRPARAPPTAAAARTPAPVPTREPGAPHS